MFRALCRFPPVFLENHPCYEWLTLEKSAFNLFTVAQFTLRSTTVSLETNPLVCQVTVLVVRYFSVFSRLRRTSSVLLRALL